MRCTDILRRDHEVITRCLDVLQSLVERTNGERIDQDDAMTLLRFLRTFVDEYHHLKEESVLFPEVMRTAEAEAGPLRHLLFEHNQERSLVEGLEDALHTGKSSDFILFANRLTHRVRNHIQKEDGVLFPILDILISSPLDEKVCLEFEKIQLDPGSLADLRRLEAKYLSKTIQ